MIQQAVKVLWNKKLSTVYYKIGLACSDHYSSAKPGQFVMLGLAGQAEPLLRRPFSIHNLLISNGITYGFELLLLKFYTNWRLKTNQSIVIPINNKSTLYSV